jgi:serine/threonine protein kinase
MPSSQFTPPSLTLRPVSVTKRVSLVLRRAGMLPELPSATPPPALDLSAAFQVPQLPPILRPRLDHLRELVDTDILMIRSLSDTDPDASPMLCAVPVLGAGEFVFKYETSPSSFHKTTIAQIAREIDAYSVVSQLAPDEGRHHFAQILGRLEERDPVRRANAVTLLGFVTEHVAPSRSLHDCVSGPRGDIHRLDTPQFVAVHAQVLFALIILHGRCGIIHNDLHTNNILVRQLPRALWFEYVVHDGDRVVRFAFPSDRMAVLFDFDRCSIKGAPPVELERGQYTCETYGHCRDEDRERTDEYRVFADDSLLPERDAVFQSVVPNRALRSHYIDEQYLCFPQFGSDAAAAADPNECERCDPPTTDVRSAWSALSNPKGPWRVLLKTDDRVADIVTHVWVYPEQRSRHRPCTTADYRKPRRLHPYASSSSDPVGPATHT